MVFHLDLEEGRLANQEKFCRPTNLHYAFSKKN